MIKGRAGWRSEVARWHDREPRSEQLYREVDPLSLRRGYLVIGGEAVNSMSFVVGYSNRHALL